MNEENDKSLEDQIKEAQIEKIRAETEDVRKRLKQVRIMGIPIVQIVFGGIVVGFILLNYLLPIISLDSDLERKKTELIEKKSEYDEILHALERSKLDTANFGLMLRQTKSDSINKALDDKARLLQIEAENSRKELTELTLEQRILRKEVESLERERTDLQIKTAMLDKKYRSYELTIDSLNMTQIMLQDAVIILEHEKSISYRMGYEEGYEEYFLKYEELNKLYLELLKKH